MPDSTSLRMYQRPQDDKPPVPWDDVAARLRDSVVYWLCAGAAARPVWGVWLDDRLWLSVGSPTVWRALQASPEASAHLEDGHDVVLVEGTWRQSEAAEELARFCDVYNEKYRWDMRPDALPGPVLVLEPGHVLAFRAGRWQDAKNDPFPLAASKFTF